MTTRNQQWDEWAEKEASRDAWDHWVEQELNELEQAREQLAEGNMSVEEFDERF